MRDAGEPDKRGSAKRLLPQDTERAERRAEDAQNLLAKRARPDEQMHTPPEEKGLVSILRQPETPKRLEKSKVRFASGEQYRSISPRRPGDGQQHHNQDAVEREARQRSNEKRAKRRERRKQSREERMRPKNGPRPKQKFVEKEWKPAQEQQEDQEEQDDDSSVCNEGDDEKSPDLDSSSPEQQARRRQKHQEKRAALERCLEAARMNERRLEEEMNLHSGCSSFESRPTDDEKLLRKQRKLRKAIEELEMRCRKMDKQDAEHQGEDVEPSNEMDWEAETPNLDDMHSVRPAEDQEIADPPNSAPTN